MQDPIEVANLKLKIQELRKELWPMVEAGCVEDLPLFFAKNENVEAYLRSWQSLIDRAKELYTPFLEDGSSEVVLPSHLNLPLIYTNVERVIINKTKAKESKTFRGLASLQEKCGEFDDEQLDAMREWLDSDDTAALVAHREFVDLRAYIFQVGESKYIRSRFFVNQLLVGTTAEFKLIDNRGKERKERSDSFKDPLADNGVWKVYGKYR